TSLSATPTYTFSLHDALPIYIRMLREAQVMAALAGTSAIRVYGLRTTGDGALYLVMELLSGADLDEYLAEIESVGQRLSIHRLRSEEHTSELQSRVDLVCRLL